MSGPEVGHDGSTYTEWLHHGVREFLAGQRDTLPSYDEFLKSFIADCGGFMTIATVANWLTGEYVDVNTEIHIADVDWLTESWQRVFEIEWKVATADERA